VFGTDRKIGEIRGHRRDDSSPASPFLFAIRSLRTIIAGKRNRVRRGTRPFSLSGEWSISAPRH